jgi:hypothetical protein
MCTFQELIIQLQLKSSSKKTIRNICDKMGAHYRNELSMKMSHGLDSVGSRYCPMAGFGKHFGSIAAWNVQ